MGGATEWTAGILAGGFSARMGRDKALMELAGRPLIRHVLDRLGRPALISANDDRLAAFGPIVRDVLPARCPVAGVHALLHAAPTDRVFVCGCDMPFVSLPLVEHLLGIDADFVLPVTPDGEEPLHAVYSKACLVPIERRLREMRLRTTDFQDLVRTERVPIDPRDWLVDGRSPFVNVNTPGEFGALI
ncbi:MAG: molybdenum cofactor guanylyltransferase [Planctomycetes bacterium]|nr:molybdenum cofactor guanylyltransferase [Planctomycetota bacterium]